QAGQSSPNLDVAFGGVGDAGHYLEQGALACPIRADNPDNVAGVHIETDIAESPKALLPDWFLLPSSQYPKGCLQAANQNFTEILVPTHRSAEHVFLGYVAKFENRSHSDDVRETTLHAPKNQQSADEEN